MEVYQTDIIIIGSGIAGANFSLNIPENVNVVVLSKSKAKDTNTYLAQGGIAAVLGDKDNIECYINDILNTGKGLSDKKAVKFLAENSKKVIKELTDLGVVFDLEQGSDIFNLGREGAHSYRRIAHIGTHTGQTVQEILVDAINEKNNIRIKEDIQVIKLLTSSNKDVVKGCLAYDKKKKNLIVFYAKVVVIATGGLGALYKYSVNSINSTGDGLALAFNTGCKIRDLEFIQFHPTALNKGRSPLFLISEALRGERGKLIAKKTRGSRYEYIMEKFPRKDLESRDIVSREIFNAIGKGYRIFLDITHKSKTWLKNRFLNTYKECLKYNIDISKDLIPVVSAAHYSCGGIKVNLYGETRIKGLFAVGEVASTGVHGANRLASTSLSESFLFSKLAAEKSISYIKNSNFNFTKNAIKKISIYSLNEFKNKKILNLENILRKTMWEYVGIIRNIKGLETGKKQIIKLKKELQFLKQKGFNIKVAEFESKLLVSNLIIDSCLKRKESRGCHFLSDYPKSKKNPMHTILMKN